MHWLDGRRLATGLGGFIGKVLLGIVDPSIYGMPFLARG